MIDVLFHLLAEPVLPATIVVHIHNHTLQLCNFNVEREAVELKERNACNWQVLNIIYVQIEVYQNR
jgi:hypothetical protein